MIMQPSLLPLEEDADNPFAHITTKAVVDVADTVVIIEALKASPVVAFDTETTGLDYMRDQLHGVSVATADAEWYICGPALLPFIEQLVQLQTECPDKLYVAHNGKFDLHFLGRFGFNPHKLADTMIAQWLVDENMELGLKSLAHTRLGITEDLPTFGELQKIVKKMVGKSKMEEVTIFDIPQNALAEYAARDARITYDLWKLLQYDLREEGMEDVFWEIEMPFSRILLEIEENGLYVNAAGLAEFERELDAQAAELARTWKDLAGDVNPNSRQQLSTLLFDHYKLPRQGKTKGGSDSVDDLTLQRLEHIDKSGVVATLRGMRRVEKLRSTYVTFLREKPIDGFIHGSFNQTGTVTGRLSSSDPNLQNIPARGDLGKQIRKLFAAPEGYTLVDIDYSQIELRMLAHDANEPNFIRAFFEKADPHQLTADMAHVARHVGKTLNFAWAYGAGPRKLADTIEKSGVPRPSETETREWLDNFNKAYPALVRYKHSLVRQARQQGYITLLSGRKRRLPEIHSFDPAARGGAERQAVNSRIQGSAADAIKWAMLQLAPLCEWYGAKMIAQVHDEVLFLVPTEHVEEFGTYASATMRSIEKQFNLRVPIEADYGSGPTWAEAK